MHLPKEESLYFLTMMHPLQKEQIETEHNNTLISILLSFKF